MRVKIFKRAFITVFALLLAFVWTGVLSSCGGNSSVSVRFVLNNGSPDIVRKAEGGSVTMPEDPVREGHIFSGWFYSPDAGVAFPGAFKNESITENTVVYARWDASVFAFSTAPGVYEAEQSLSLLAAENRPVFYTVDGSNPVKLSLSGGVYAESGSTKVFDPENPIIIKNRTTERPRLAEAAIGMWTNKLNIGSYNGSPQNYNRGTVVKAAVLNKDGTLGSVHTGTYIVWPDYQKEFDLPIMSIALPQQQLFAKRGDPIAPEGGIYRYYDDSLDGYIATIEYFDKDKAPVFFRDGELRVSNGKYAGGAPMKTFNVNLNRGIYNEAVEYPLWGNFKRGARGEPLESFSRFRLRQAGQSYAYGGYNHVLAQKLAECLNPAVSASVYTAVYLNGDFWGIYALEEQYNDRYLASHYGGDRRNMIQLAFKSNCDNVPDVEDGSAASAKELYRQLYEFAKNNDFTDPEVYKEFGEKYMDLNDYTDALLCHIFFNNPDFPGNNNRMWRAETPRTGSAYMDGRWHQMLYDFDAAFLADAEGRWDLQQDMLAHLLGERMVNDEIGKLNPGWSTLFFRRLMSNEVFRARFLDRAAYFYNYVLEPGRVAAYADGYYHTLKTMQRFQSSRWMLDVNLEKVRDDLKAAIATRREAVMQHFSEHYSANTHTAYATLNGDTEFDGEKNNPTCSHADSIVPVELELTTENGSKANQTRLGWEYSYGSGDGESITEWTDAAAVKKLKIFSGTELSLSNGDPDFLRYEVSLGGGAVTSYTARDCRITVGTEKITVRTVYK